jgi:hypothetical protein
MDDEGTGGEVPGAVLIPCERIDRRRRDSSICSGGLLVGSRLIRGEQLINADLEIIPSSSRGDQES